MSSNNPNNENYELDAENPSSHPNQYADHENQDISQTDAVYPDTDNHLSDEYHQDGEDYQYNEAGEYIDESVEYVDDGTVEDLEAIEPEFQGVIGDGVEPDEVRLIKYTTNPDDDGAKEYAAQMGVQSVIRENERLQDHIGFHKRQLKFSLLVNCALAALSILMFFAFLSFPKTKYIATKDNASICEVYPRDNPNLTDGTIREFGKDAVINLYTFDYVNYEEQINSVLDRNFTAIGRGATVKAMEDAGIFTYVTENALTFKATAKNAVRIEEKAVNSDGKDYWVLRFPMVLDIYSGQAQPINTQTHMVTVRVVADTASVTNPNGLGISSVTLAPL